MNIQIEIKEGSFKKEIKYFFRAVWWAIGTADVPIDLTGKLFEYYELHLAAEEDGYRIVIYDGSILRVRRSVACDPYLKSPRFVVYS